MANSYLDSDPTLTQFQTIQPLVLRDPYDLPDTLPACLVLEDHLGGFDQNFYNHALHSIDQYAKQHDFTIQVHLSQILEPAVKQLYPNLNIHFAMSDSTMRAVWNQLKHYHEHPELDYKNFVCSFNGSDHVSRQLLVAIMHRFGYFDHNYCSKNFVMTADRLDGHISDAVGHRDSFYRKFFMHDNPQDQFFDTIYSFGLERYNHAHNIYNLEHKITQSFLHVVSETKGTSYAPFVTEKFLYSVVTRGLFLACAQPGWHDHVEKYYGFKKYTKLFDYHFDSITNPVERLIELMTMIGKFKHLSQDDWKSLYLLEQDTIEHNYDNYFSGQYLKRLQSFYD